jgi:mitochondrial chaperone BCS1
MEPSSAPNAVPSAAPSAADLILQQRTGTSPTGQATVQQVVPKGDGSLWSQVTSNPLFTAVCGIFQRIHVAKNSDR